MRLWKKRSGDGRQGGWRVTKELREKNSFFPFYLFFSVSCRRLPVLEYVFWSISGNLFQRVDASGHCGMTLCLSASVLFEFSPNPRTVSLHWGEERRERGGLYGETSSCGQCGAISYTHLYARLSERGSCIRSVWRWATNAETTGLGMIRSP